MATNLIELDYLILKKLGYAVVMWLKTITKNWLIGYNN